MDKRSTIDFKIVQNGERVGYVINSSSKEQATIQASKQWKDFELVEVPYMGIPNMFTNCTFDVKSLTSLMGREIND
jgi:hypothetical protein